MSASLPADRPGLVRSLLALVLFGVSFGFVEAAVVVYLRALYDPIHQRLHPERSPGDLFPLVRLQELEAEGPSARRRLEIELVREFATLVMLAAVGLAVGRTAREAVAGFVAAFGIWDVAFYAWLRLLIGWPESFWTWDLLFLLPLPWTGPVLAPLVVAVLMVASGVVVLVLEGLGRGFRPLPVHWATILAGGVVVIVAFCWDYRNVLNGGWPRPFHWPLFILGMAIGLLGFFGAVGRSRARAPGTIEG